MEGEIHRAGHDGNYVLKRMTFSARGGSAFGGSGERLAPLSIAGSLLFIWQGKIHVEEDA